MKRPRVIWAFAWLANRSSRGTLAGVSERGLPTEAHADVVKVSERACQPKLTCP
jgi:hypothetical protein